MIFKENCFYNKRYLVSGASSGMGAHISYELNKMGAEIIAIGRDEQKLKNKKKDMCYPEKFIEVIKDITEISELDRWVLKLAKEYGSFDGAVLSAGIQQTAPITSVLSVESALALFSANYFGNLQLIKGLLDRRAKTNEGAGFVWISSNASIKAQKGLVNYSASKNAINAAVKSLALEIAPKFRINAVSPGFVMTEMIEQWSSVYNREYIENIDKSYPLGIGSVDKISPLVCFLLSEDASWITGQNIVIDGGGSL